MTAGIDDLLTTADHEEALSRSYVRSIASHCRYIVLDMDFDRDGIDLQIKAGGSMRPSIDLQLKATINLGEIQNDVFRFPLKRRNYDLLRIETMIPRILVLLDLPRDEERWLTISSDELILRRCAYWVSLRGQPETDNVETVTISLPARNRFNDDELRRLMDMARSGIIT